MTDDAPEYTPRAVLEPRLDRLADRRKAIKDVVGTGGSLPTHAEHYLNGYADALELAHAELDQVADSEIMGHSPQTDAALLAEVLKSLWGQNPQAPVTDLELADWLTTLSRVFDERRVAAALDRTGWDGLIDWREADDAE